MRAILYVRISELTDATTSPERQLRECQEYAARAGLDVVGSFEDLDVSGRKTLEKRPGLLAALDAIEQGRAEYLVAAKIDRVARSVVTFNRVVQALQERGAALISVAEGLDFGTPAGRMIANVLAVFAQFESEQIGARVASAKAHLVEQGKWPGGRRPFGWTPEEAPDGKGYVLALHPEEAPELRRMVQKALAGESFRSIAADLNRRGVSTAIGKAWVGRTVQQALTKGAMIGQNGEEPLLDPDAYVALQRALDQGSARSRKPAEAAHSDLPASLFEEDLTCGACGASMGHGIRVDRGKPVRTYRCSNRKAPGATDGCWLTVTAPRVDEVVEERLLAAFGHLEASTLVEPVLVDPAAEERAELESALRRLEEDRYLRDAFSGPEGASRFDRLYADFQGRLDALPRPYVDTSSAGVTVPTGATFAETWESFDVEKRRSLLRLMVGEVVVHPTEKRGNRFDRGRVEVLLPDGLPLGA